MFTVIRIRQGQVLHLTYEKVSIVKILVILCKAILMIMDKKMNVDENIGYILIDPPVTPHSSEEDILAWIKKLKTYPDRPEVREAISQAQEYIKMKKEFEE